MNKKSRRICQRIEDIREAIENARSDLGTLTKEEFLSDGKTQRAIIKSLIVIGESAHAIMQLDPSIESASPDAWQHFKDVYQMRIVLTHAYFRIDAAVVWDTISNDFPKLEIILATLPLSSDTNTPGSSVD